jgi:hypothetical protein
LGVAEIGSFLDHLAGGGLALASLHEARDALDFLYREVLRIDLGELPAPRLPLPTFSEGNTNTPNRKRSRFCGSLRAPAFSSPWSGVPFEHPL